MRIRHVDFYWHISIRFCIVNRSNEGSFSPSQTAHSCQVSSATFLFCVFVALVNDQKRLVCPWELDQDFCQTIIASLEHLIMAPTKKGISPGKPKSSSSGPKISLARVKGENFYRTGKQVARLKLLNSGKAVRDKDGKIIQAAAFQKGEDETKPGRVQPDRRWFGTYSVYNICSSCNFM